MQELCIDLVKLLLGILAFVLIVSLGTRDKRVGGVFLTFPLLNGIAMLTGVEPLGIARTIYLVAMWNCGLFLLTMHQYRRLPPLSAASQAATINIRVLTWTALWATGAAILALSRDVLSVASVLFAIQLVIAGLYVWLWWGPRPPRSTSGFRKTWFNKEGAGRLAYFVAAFFVVLVFAYFVADSRWVGWASALPLPGLFALATLSAIEDKEDLVALGDTVLLGPIFVIPFNWLLAHVLIMLRAERAGTLAEIATVTCFWVATFLLVFALVPPFARWRDELRSPGRESTGSR